MTYRDTRFTNPTETLHLRLEGSLEEVPGLTWHEERDEDGHGEELHGVDLYSVFVQPLCTSDLIHRCATKPRMGQPIPFQMGFGG